MLTERQELYQLIENTMKNPHVELHAIYEPEAGDPVPDCYLAAIDLFKTGQTYRLYFKIDENDQIEVVHLERWRFG